MKRTLKVIRYTKHQSIGMSPFEKHFGRPHNSEINEIFGLENPGKFIMEHVADLDDLEVWDNTWRDAEVDQFEREKLWKKQANRRASGIREEKQIC